VGDATWRPVIRWSNWNRAEDEVSKPRRTMSQQVSAAIHDGQGDARCPLCTLTFPCGELEVHIGSHDCARNLVDLAVMRVVTS